MPKCAKCGYILPPQFMTKMSEKDSLCQFCVEDKLILTYSDGRKKVNRKDIADEYKLFLKMVREKNDILKDAMKGDASGIPEKLIG